MDGALSGCRPHGWKPMAKSTIRGIHSILSGALRGSDAVGVDRPAPRRVGQAALWPARIARLKPSCSVRFTNRCYGTGSWRAGFPAIPARATTYPSLSFIPSPVAHPHESRSSRQPGQRTGPGGELV